MNLSWMTAAAITTALAVLPAAAHADGSESVTKGPVTATLSWSGETYDLAGARLVITRQGVTAYDSLITEVACDGCVIQGSEDVSFTDLDRDGEPEVIVTGYTAGHSCCATMGLYDYRPDTGRYDEIARNWGSAGFEIADAGEDGFLEIVTVDTRFEERFGSAATSFPPPAVFGLEHPAKLNDVTTLYPELIEDHARQAKRLFRRYKAGAVSAYVADQYLLGHGPRGLKELDRQIHRGIVTKAFRRKLLSTLDRYGYR